MGPSTIFMPLAGSPPLPDSPSFLIPCNDPSFEVSKVLKMILKAKRVVVLCGEGSNFCFVGLEEITSSPLFHFQGAGISVRAGIPDFRSSEGLFQSLKKDNPKEALLSGRDLFDASVFNVSSLYISFA
jgi:hypothetical protein